MGEMRQSPAERQRLIDIWHGHPAVKQLRADVQEFAAHQRLTFNQAGMSAVLEYASAWIAACDEWPETGILIG